jgi:glucose-1-phosphate cytidylyltransferase
MKVVLFCGGLGTRLRGVSDHIPKPMVKIGSHPILLHLMKYYAYFGHTDFILCLGYMSEVIKEYFLKFNEYIVNDFTMCNGGKDLLLPKKSDLQNWTITFVDTGLRANIGQRLSAVKPYLEKEEMFLANYADGLTNLPLSRMIEFFKKSDKIGSFLCVKPSQSFHVVSLNGSSFVTDIRYVRDTDLLINGGYFIFRQEIFNYLKPGEELVEEPFKRLIAAEQLLGYRYDQFWCMDTFKEHQELNDMYEKGYRPWEVWKTYN